MLRRIGTWALALVLGMGAVTLGQVPATTRHGMNLSGGTMNYDTSSFIFADLIKSAGAFNGFRGKVPAPFLPSGWPSRVDEGTGPTTLVMALNARLPVGDYTLTGKGVGRIGLQGPFEGAVSGWKYIDLNGDSLPRVVKLTSGGVPWAGQIPFHIISSNAGNPIRDVSFVVPGHVGKTFYQPFLNDIAPFSALRFKDWQGTDGFMPPDFAHRSAPHFSYWGSHRIPEEVCFELANLANKDVWMCIPTMASDDYVKQLALLADKTLKPGLTIYVEYSNEVWNYYFPQWKTHTDAYNKEKPGIGMWEYIARQDGKRTNLFKSTLPATRRCVRVLARQLGYAGTITSAMKQYKLDGYGFDAIAAAPYVEAPIAVTRAATALFKTDPASAITNVLNGMDPGITEVTGYCNWYQAQADANNVPFMLYEGGQGLVNWQDDNSTPLLIAVNRDPRMGLVYQKLLAALPPKLNLAMWFQSDGTWTKYGCWGHKEYTGQPEATAHKYRVIANAARALAPVNPVPPPVIPPPVPPENPVPPVVPPPVSPIAVLAYLKALGLDGYVQGNVDGSYAGTIRSDAAPGYVLKKLTPQP